MKIENLKILLWLILFLLVCNITVASAEDDYVKYLKPLWREVNRSDMNEPKVSGEGDTKWYVEKSSSQSHFFYVLLSDDRVVYCGITNDPERRTLEHRQNKIFDRMVAAGRLSEEVTRRKEMACVCKYNGPNLLNKLPRCPLPMYGGGYDGGDEYEPNKWYPYSESNYVVKDEAGQWYIME